MRPPNQEFGGWFWTNLRIYTPWKVVSVVLVCAVGLVSCGREGLIASRIPEPKEVEYGDSQTPRGAGPGQEAASKISSAAQQLRVLLREADKPERIRSEIRLISAEAAKLRASFAGDRKKLRVVGASAALARLDRIERRLTSTARQFNTTTAAYLTDPTPAASDAMLSALEALAPEPTAEPLSAQTGFQNRPAPANSLALSAGIVPAYGAPSESVSASELPRTPESADLEASHETAINAAIDAKATDLHHNAAEIFSWVRDNIAYQPYQGIRKGAAETLAEEAGSSADQSALTIALLRASHIPARFVRGNVELTPERAAGWLGVDIAHGQHPEAALDILAGGGIPVTRVNRGGRFAAVRFEHFWVEAYASTDAYRGATDLADAPRKWMPLDPSIKQAEFVAPTVDLHDAIDGSVADLMHEAQASASGSDRLFKIDDPNRLMSAINHYGEPSTAPIGAVKFGDLGYTRAIRRALAYVPGTLPARVLSTTAEYRSIPAVLQATVQIDVAGADPLRMPRGELDPDVSFGAPTWSLAANRVTVGYAAASDTDAAALDQYHGLLNAPAFAGAVVPVIRVAGHVKAVGSAPTPIAYQQRLRLTYRSPGFAADVVDNAVTAGALSALALDYGNPNRDELSRRADALHNATVTADNVLTDRHAGEMLSLLGANYFIHGDRANWVLSKVAQVSAARQLSGALVATGLSVATVAGFPVHVSLGGLQIDVDQDVQNVVSLTGDSAAEQRYVSTSGAMASFNEATAIAGGAKRPGVSTATVLGAAVTQGMYVRRITSANAGDIDALQQPAWVKSDVRSAVDDGATVTVPNSQVMVDGTPYSAYIVETALGADYRVGGGLSGGLLPVITDLGSDVGDVFLGYAQKLFGFSDWVKGCLSAPLTSSAAMMAALAGVEVLKAAIAFFWASPLLLPVVLIGLALLSMWVYTWYANAWNQAYECIDQSPYG
jgi:hypothetical protein